jgi:serine/threonine-protein kinase
MSMPVDVPIGTTLAGYRVERLLGHGAMGAVYLARDEHLDRPVALKLLPRELASDQRFRDRFLRESRLAATLEHPSIVTVYSAGEADGLLYLAMRFVDGGDLGELIDRDGRLEPDRALDIVGQVAGALDAAHGRGLIHRDVKPGNILVSGERIYLSDFGLAKHASTVNSLSRDSPFSGTIDYMAPEQIQGGAVDGRCDVYALGCVLFETLAGRPPFERETDVAVVFAHLKEPPPLLSALRPDVPEALDGVIGQALAKKPDDRYQTCAELVAGARAAIGGGWVPEAAGGHALLRTFLFADIRGYTKYTQQHGDEAGAELARRFAEEVEGAVIRHRGRLIELRGDEALVVFESAREALQAAIAIQAAVQASDLPRGVGVGLDAGEAVPVGGGYRGGALNTAARLCSLAGPGDILATDSVTHLARKVDGIRYLEGRVERLKGIDHPVRVVEVVPHQRGDAVLRRLRRRTHGRRWIPLAGIAAAIAGLAVLLLVVLGGGKAATPFRPGLVLLDIKTRQQVGFLSPSEIAAPAFPLFSGGHLWMMNFTPSSYVEIDPQTGRVLTQFAPPSGSHDTATYQPYAVEGTSLWTGSGHDLVRMDTDLGKEVDRFHLDRIAGGSGVVEGVATGGGYVWVGRDVGIGQVIALDPATGKVRYRFTGVQHHLDIAYGEGLVWTADFGGVSVIDPRTNAVTPVEGITSTSQYVVSGGGFGWTSDPAKGVVYKISPDAHIAATYHTGLGASNVSFTDGVLWVANQDVGTVTAIDAITGTQTTQRFGHPVGIQGAGAGVLATSLQTGPTIDGRFAALEGSVVKLFSQQGAFGDGDEPALNWNAAAMQIAFATCAKLLNYPDEPAPQGLKLRPEVAAAMPSVSPDGRTYTFIIRSGYRFSPPSNQPLTAETFRHSIERALSPKLGGFQPAAYFVDDIQGEQAFRAGRAPYISGLRASGARLEITLSQPSPTILERLALPFFCPVPDGTPFVRGALLRGSGGLSAGQLPSAGPYYVADYNNDEYVILKRNPNYHGPRPHELDAIALREGVDAGYAVDHVQHGGWNGIVSSGHNGSTPIDPLLAPGGAIAARYENGADSGDQYFPIPLPGSGDIALNASRAPFADSSIRRAVALALDRTAIAAAWNQAPSDQLLPPMFPAGPVNDQPPARGDVAAARALMHGRRITAVMAIFKDCAPCSRVANELKAQLGPIGIRVAVTVHDNAFTAAERPGASIDILDTGVYDFPYPDSAGWLEQLLVTISPPGWVPADAAHDVSSATRLRGPRRQTEAAALARRLTTSVVPVVPYGATVQGELLAPSLGCRIFPPFGYGVDLAALCLADR